MRVISGKARGTKLNTIESIKTRPTLDRVKESLFNIIQSEILDAVVLDLFAGSGALGIEALSRGANKAIFCDNNSDAIKIISENLNKTHLFDKAELYNMDYKKMVKLWKDNLKNHNSEFDIIFVDPPYKLDYAVTAIKLILDNQILKPNGKIIIETDESERDLKELELIKGIKIYDTRKYGRASLIFVKRDE